MIDASEVKKLTLLSRIDMNEKEMKSLTKDLESILEYVGRLENSPLFQDSSSMFQAPRNVFREDKAPHESSIYTDKILSLAPKSEGGYIKVDKIIKEV